MVKLVIALVLWSHWQACLWGLVSNFMDDAGYPNWLGNFRAKFELDFQRKAQWGDTYLAAWYWSVQTLTSVGYGEMLPVNTAERALCAVYMLMSGVVWTYAIGTVASIATTLDPNGIKFHNSSALASPVEKPVNPVLLP
jgi:hypothetical protein